jgi:Ser/Thr protein kinase RdoA (MazF antagonist)
MRSDRAQQLTRYRTLARMALPAWGIPANSPIHLVCLSENATYRVEDLSHGRLAALRIHRAGYQPPGAVESELAWLQALRADASIPTAAIIPTIEGSLVARAGDHQVVLFEWLAGQPPSPSQLPQRMRALGELAARMHRHSRTWRRPPGFVRFRWDVPACLGPQPRWGPWQAGRGVGPAEREILGRAAAVAIARLARLGTGPEHFGLIHADMRLANLLIDGDRLAIIDFDDCGFSWYLYDLACTLSFLEDRPDVVELCHAWLTGYRRLAPIAGELEAEIPTFIMLRRLALLGWTASHASADEVTGIGPAFALDSCKLAEAYLSLPS